MSINMTHHTSHVVKPHINNNMTQIKRACTRCLQTNLVINKYAVSIISKDFLYCNTQNNLLSK